MKKRISWHNSSIMDRILTVYLWILMVGLFLQGSGSLALRLSSGLEAITPPLLAGILLAHIAHAILHIVWGLIGIVVLAVFRSARASLWLGLVFGIFYTLLAIVGTMDSHIFELHLAPSENIFHWIVGPLTLGLSLLAWYIHLHSTRARAKLFASRPKAV